ncbi:WD repeat-containing protein on Y chromosome-like [Acanthopagrus schlegelii]
MKKIYSSVSEEELAALHMQIDTHCKGTVNLDELVSFLLSKIEAYEALDYMHHSFPKPFQRVPMDFEQLVTGGTDGSLRVWFPNNPSCIETLKGHDKPITNLMQSIQVENIGQAPITSICYNIHNNELVLANSDITKCLGEGTDVFRESLTSHEKPLCCALYHSFFKRVISCCQKGEVTVWDILTGNAVMQFQVTPSKTNRHTFMSFDGQQQSLITVCQDGKLRRWNFSNGKELAVHPVTVQKDAKADTATLLTSADGYIYAWSVICTGGLLGKFRAVKDDEAVITTMSTDVNEEILLTGDSTGRICRWDIRRFGFKRQANNGPFEKRNGWLVSLCPPPLLESWQAHPTAVVSVECDPACTNIITAGLDCNVCRWTNKGICIGVFGKDRWDTTQLHPKEDPDEEQTENSDTDELFSVKRIPASPYGPNVGHNNNAIPVMWST